MDDARIAKSPERYLPDGPPLAEGVHPVAAGDGVEISRSKKRVLRGQASAVRKAAKPNVETCAPDFVHTSSMLQTLHGQLADLQSRPAALQMVTILQAISSQLTVIHEVNGTSKEFQTALGRLVGDMLANYRMAFDAMNQRLADLETSNRVLYAANPLAATLVNASVQTQALVEKDDADVHTASAQTQACDTLARNFAEAQTASDIGVDDVVSPSDDILAPAPCADEPSETLTWNQVPLYITELLRPCSEDDKQSFLTSSMHPEFTRDLVEISSGLFGETLGPEHISALLREKIREGTVRRWNTHGVLVGLRGAAHLNGQLATIVSFDITKDRYIAIVQGNKILL
jgi:hypothetical protein